MSLASKVRVILSLEACASDVVVVVVVVVVYVGDGSALVQDLDHHTMASWTMKSCVMVELRGVSRT